MAVFRVIRKTDRKTVYAYSSDAVVCFAEYPFSEYDHVVEVAVRDDMTIASDPKRRLTKLQLIDRMGDAAYVAILQIAKESVDVEAFVKRFEYATPEADGTSVDLDDPRTIAGMTEIGNILEANNVVAAGWAAKVLA